MTTTYRSCRTSMQSHATPARSAAWAPGAPGAPGAWTYGKITTLLFATVITAASLLGMRQNRLHTVYQIACLHRHARQIQQDLWSIQARITQRVEPTHLRLALEQAGLNLEPIGTLHGPDDDTPTLAVLDTHRPEDP